MTETIHDDVSRALAAFGARGFSYRTFGPFLLRPRVADAAAPAPPATGAAAAVAMPEPAAPAESAAPVELPAAEPSADVPEPPPALLSVAPVEPAFDPLPAARPEPAPAPLAPPPRIPLEPAYPPVSGPAPAEDPYLALAAFARGYLYEAPPLERAPPERRRPVDRPRPPADLAPSDSGAGMFQLAWKSPARPADSSDRAGPRLAAKEGPFPGEEDLFRRI